MVKPEAHFESLSVAEASSRGVSAIAREASLGHDVIIEKHGTPVAAVVGMQRLREINDISEDLRSAALVLSRMAADTGDRFSLDEVLESLGLERDELEAELDNEIAAGLH